MRALFAWIKARNARAAYRHQRRAAALAHGLRFAPRAIV